MCICLAEQLGYGCWGLACGQACGLTWLALPDRLPAKHAGRSVVNIQLCIAAGITIMPALQVVAKKPDGASSPPSGEDIFTTPSAGAPILTSADAWGPTSGQATATPPPGVTFTSVRRCAKQVAPPHASGTVPCSCGPGQQPTASRAHLAAVIRHLFAPLCSTPSPHVPGAAVLVWMSQARILMLGSTT